MDEMRSKQMPQRQKQKHKVTGKMDLDGVSVRYDLDTKSAQKEVSRTLLIIRAIGTLRTAFPPGMPTATSVPVGRRYMTA